MLQKYLLEVNADYLTALKKIDSNKSGFVVLVDSDNKAINILTDGDIRRAFIAGKHVEDMIEIDGDKRFTYINVHAEFVDTIDIFKDESIKMLPILDDEMHVINIITKAQMHALLLQDMHVKLTHDFLSVDESIIDHEIFKRPWGFYKTTVINDYFQSKVISVSPKQALSLQSHNHREEYWIIAHGEGQVRIGDSVMNVQVGSNMFIPKGCKHRLINISETENLIVIEVQIGDYFGEDDIHRYEDVYGRV